MFVVHPDSVMALATALHHERLATARRNHAAASASPRAHARTFSAHAGRAFVRTGEWLLDRNAHPTLATS